MFDYLQVYESSPSEIQQLKLISGKKVIVAIKTKDQQTVDLHRQYIEIADSFLFDGSSSYGTSSSFNWDYLKSIKSSFFLAGGIGARGTPSIFVNEIFTPGYISKEQIINMLK